MNLPQRSDMFMKPTPARVVQLIDAIDPDNTDLATHRRIEDFIAAVHTLEYVAVNELEYVQVEGAARRSPAELKAALTKLRVAIADAELWDNVQGAYDMHVAQIKSDLGDGGAQWWNAQPTLEDTLERLLNAIDQTLEGINPQRGKKVSDARDRALLERVASAWHSILGLWPKPEAFLRLAAKLGVANKKLTEDALSEARATAARKPK